MLSSWAVEEMKSADLNDKRLNRRLEELLSALGERPTASILAACGGYADTLAAYRFFDNDKVTFERVLDFTRPEQQMEGAGFLDASARRGAFLHPLVAFTPDGTPLGACWAKVWTRPEPVDETRTEYEHPRYRARGWQIGSGPVESGCKRVVTQRLKGAGMRWGERGADLGLCCLTPSA